MSGAASDAPLDLGGGKPIPAPDPEPLHWYRLTFDSGQVDVVGSSLAPGLFDAAVKKAKATKDHVPCEDVVDFGRGNVATLVGSFEAWRVTAHRFVGFEKPEGVL